jgi:NADH-quinone oxidoreductase subunit C
MTAAQSATSMQEKFNTAVLSRTEFRGDSALTVELGSLYSLLKHAKEALGYDMLMDICSIDNSGTDPRFEIVYHLYNLSTAATLRIKSAVSEDVSEVPSVVDLWLTADWHEREVWDMMGIKFTNHPDLRRILMWEGFPHFPLRKEFPLAGKSTDVPDVAFTDAAPLAGGPFVTPTGAEGIIAREPRARGE